MNYTDFTIPHLAIEISNMEQYKSEFIVHSNAYNDLNDKLKILREIKKIKEAELIVQRNKKFIDAWKIV